MVLEYLRLMPPEYHDSTLQTVIHMHSVLFVCHLRRFHILVAINVLMQLASSCRTCSFQTFSMP